MDKLVIDRAKWACGNRIPNDSNHLLNKDGSMCCLGFDAVQLRGLNDSQIYMVSEPQDIENSWDVYPDWMVTGEEDEDDYGGSFHFGINSNDVDDLMSFNDDKQLSDEDREAYIAKRFLENGIEVEYIGEYPTEEETSS